MKMQQTQPRTFCFVLMPFAQEFEDVYELGIKAACDDANTYCERVDEQIFEGSVLERIYNQISRADIIIADMSGRNANVFYEVGYAHALGKPTILLTKSHDDIPFDLKHFPHIVYTRISELRETLAKRVAWFAEQPREASEYKSDIEIYCEDVALSTGKAVCRYQGDAPYGELLFRNTSLKILEEDSFRVGFVINASRQHVFYGLKYLKQPQNEKVYMFGKFDRLFPGACCTKEFTMRSYEDAPLKEVVVRMFLGAGYSDFPLQLLRTDIAS